MKGINPWFIAGDAIRDSIATKEAMFNSKNVLSGLSKISSELIAVFQNKKKLLIAGNGGSAADAQHFAAEITCQFVEKRKGRPALALHTDTSALTAWGNDHSFETVFARQVEAHGNQGDALVVISTSGNSKNLVCAARTARAAGLSVYGLLGRDGGTLVREELCDVALVIPSESTARIQECHILCIHILCEILDQYFLEEDTK